MQKKTSSRTRALKMHTDTMVELLENLSELFPDCAETKDCLLFAKNVVVGNDKKLEEAVEVWCENMKDPLVKGCAKYLKAVESITRKPACVYHAMVYRDLDALETSSTSPSLRRIDLCAKARSSQMDAKAVELLWEYMDDLSKFAFEALPETSKWKEIPMVPTRDEIQKDIQRRKLKVDGKRAPDSEKHSLSQGIQEAMTAFCYARKMPSIEVTEDGARDIVSALESDVDGETCASRCRKKEATGFRVLSSAFPSAEWGDADPSEEEWDHLSKLIGMCTMKGSIPTPMMAGIETVANKLMQDLSSGKADLSSLSMESIGQQVLAGVSQEEMAQFASNIDKIMPALGSLQP